MRFNHQQAKAILIVFVTLTVCGALLWWFAETESAPRPPIRNVVLISIDTCRADHLSCYGYRDQTTPEIDAVAAEGFVFQNALSPVPLTLPSHCTMLTGTSPLYHAVHDNHNYRLGQANLTLAEILKENGFTTGAVIGAVVLDSRYGLNQGFDAYHDRFEQADDTVGIAERRGEEVSRDALQWLDDHQQDRFFLFVHYYDPHRDYLPPEPFAARFPNSTYAGEIAYTDYCVGQVLAKLKDLGLYDSTLIIITSDHGEMLGEHGELTHGYFIYRSAVRVPLILKLPGDHPSRRLDDLVGLVDIVPTVCDLLDLEPPAAVQGHSVRTYLQDTRSPAADRHLYCETLHPTLINASPLLAVVTPRWKYIHTRRPELYDLEKDLDESVNLAGELPDRTRLMKERLQRILQDDYRPSLPATKDTHVIKQLESLGYIGGASDRTEEAFDLDRMDQQDDAKDLIDFYEVLLEAKALHRQERYAEAKSLCHDLLRRRPEIAHIHSQLAEIAMDLDDTSAAIGHYEEALRRDADQPEAHNNLAGLLNAQGRLDEAMDHGRRALQLDPNLAEAYFNMAVTFQLQGDLDDAVAHYRRSLEIYPNYAEAHKNLAVILASQGEVDKAIEHLGECLRIAPGNAEAHYDLGKALASQNKVEEAIDHYQEALGIKSDYAAAHLSLAHALEVSGNQSEAINHYRRVTEIDPENAAAHYLFAFRLDSHRMYEQAIGQYRKVLRLQPNHTEALNNLAWQLATCPESALRRPEEAVELARRASEAVEDRVLGILDTLAASYAAAGQFDQAVKTAKAAIELAMDTEAHELADSIRKHLELFEQGRPYVNLQ